MVTGAKNSRAIKSPHHSALPTRKSPTQTHPDRKNSAAHWNWARYYHAELGRFISRDPIGYVDGMNLYRAYFVPGTVDPNGTHTREECLQAYTTALFLCHMLYNKCMSEGGGYDGGLGGLATWLFCESAKQSCDIGAESAYYACLALAEEGPGPGTVLCGGGLIVVGGVICCLDTPAPGPADCVGGPIVALGVTVICSDDEDKGGGPPAPGG
jgi:RHS repeat-associated protein